MKLVTTIIFCLFATFLSAQVPAVPSNAKWFSNLDDASGWIGCSACADWGVTSNYWFKQGITAPSMDGHAMEMYIKGSWGVWADDLFIKALGDQTWARHIEWSTDFQWTAPKTKQSNGQYVVQAIEFDTRMIIGDFKYHFGSQCDYAKGNWDIWNNTGRYWFHTGVPCQRWGPNTWHKVTWYVTIDNTAKYLHYIGLMVDGKQYWINQSVAPGAVPYSKQFLIQIEQDTDQAGDPWSLFIDRTNVALW